MRMQRDNHKAPDSACRLPERPYMYNYYYERHDKTLSNLPDCRVDMARAVVPPVSSSPPSSPCVPLARTDMYSPDSQFFFFFFSIKKQRRRTRSAITRGDIFMKLLPANLGPLRHHLDDILRYVRSCCAPVASVPVRFCIRSSRMFTHAPAKKF